MQDWPSGVDDLAMWSWQLSNWQCGQTTSLVKGKTRNVHLAKHEMRKVNLTKIPEHFVQTILVRLAKTQPTCWLGSSLKYEKPTTFLFPQFGEGGGFLVALRRRGVCCCVCETWLASSFLLLWKCNAVKQSGKEGQKFMHGVHFI